jgi:hypothetical protein
MNSLIFIFPLTIIARRCHWKKSRLAALESLRTANSRSIVVASDVAARGLDIASVTTVIHYDVARVVDTFIHRAGRTAVGHYFAKHLRFLLSRLCALCVNVVIFMAMKMHLGLESLTSSGVR